MRRLPAADALEAYGVNITFPGHRRLVRGRKCETLPVEREYVCIHVLAIHGQCLVKRGSAPVTSARCARHIVHAGGVGYNSPPLAIEIDRRSETATEVIQCDRILTNHSTSKNDFVIFANSWRGVI